MNINAQKHKKFLKLHWKPLCFVLISIVIAIILLLQNVPAVLLINGYSADIVFEENIMTSSGRYSPSLPRKAWSKVIGLEKESVLYLIHLEKRFWGWQIVHVSSSENGYSLEMQMDDEQVIWQAVLQPVFNGSAGIPDSIEEDHHFYFGKGKLNTNYNLNLLPKNATAMVLVQGDYLLIKVVRFLKYGDLENQNETTYLPFVQHVFGLCKTER